MKKILIVSDAWWPQVNGVVRSLEVTVKELKARGHAVEVVGPDPARWCTWPMPSYPSIKLEFFAGHRLRKIFDSFQPDFVHIATEGPLGWAMRAICLTRNRPYTTSYHTSFPEYLEARMPFGLGAVSKFFAYRLLRRFHAPAGAVMVATPTVEAALRKRNFRHIVRWSRGVETGLYNPMRRSEDIYGNLPRPILINVGRVSVEKNLDAFLSLKTSGTKVVVGDGPALLEMKHRYKDVVFVGARVGDDLAAHYASADIFVFPSRTDTFGLVLLEAAASGLKIAAYPVAGPVDIFPGDECAKFVALDHDLARAVEKVLQLPAMPDEAVRYASRYSWQACTDQFFNALQAPTPVAVRRITRFKNWLARWWQHALAFYTK